MRSMMHDLDTIPPYRDVMPLYRDPMLRGHDAFITDLPFLFQVQPGTPSETHLERGDVILSVEGTDVTNYTHSEALALLNRAGGNITFGLIRGCSNPMSLMIKSEVVTISGTITSYSFDAPKAQR